jgi:hypothetical protein
VLTAEGGGVLSLIVTAASVLLLLLTKIHPLWPLAGGALIFSRQAAPRSLSLPRAPSSAQAPACTPCVVSPPPEP